MNDKMNNRNNLIVIIIIAVIVLFVAVSFLAVLNSYLMQHGGSNEIVTVGINRTRNVLESIVLGPLRLFPFALIGVLIYWIFSQKGVKEREYDEKVLQRAIQEIMPGAEFIRKECIPPSTLLDYGIIPKYDSYRKNSMIRYSRDGKEYVFSNLELVNEWEDKDGNRKYRTFYEGQVYTVHYRTNLPGYVRIFTTKMVPFVHIERSPGYSSKRNGEEKIETENILFNDNFDVYATDQQSAFFVLDPIVMEQLLEMKNQYEQFGIYISQDDMVISLKTDRILFNTKFYNAEREEQDFQTEKEEVQSMMDLAKLLEDAINGNIRNNFTNYRKD